MRERKGASLRRRAVQENNVGIPEFPLPSPLGGNAPRPRDPQGGVWGGTGGHLLQARPLRLPERQSVGEHGQSGREGLLKKDGGLEGGKPSP